MPAAVMHVGSSWLMCKLQARTLPFHPMLYEVAFPLILSMFLVLHPGTLLDPEKLS